MNDATLAQGNQVLNLILQKKLSVTQLQALNETGLLSDLLDAVERARGVDRDKFRELLGLDPILRSFIINVSDTKKLHLPNIYNPNTYNTHNTYVGWKVIEDVNGPVGTLEIKLVKVLENNEVLVTGEVATKRAAKLWTMLGLRHADALLNKSSFEYSIPREWQRYWLIFPGTICLDSNANRCVPCLRWYMGCWQKHWNWLVHNWDERDRFVVCK